MDHTFDYELMSCLYDDMFGYSQANEDAFTNLRGSKFEYVNGVRGKSMSTHKMTLIERIKRFLSHLIERISIWIEKVFKRPLKSKSSFSNVLDSKLDYSSRVKTISQSIEKNIIEATKGVKNTQLIIYNLRDGSGKTTPYYNGMKVTNWDDFIEKIDDLYDHLKSGAHVSNGDTNDHEDFSRVIWSNFVLPQVNKGVFHELEYMLKRLKESVGDCQKTCMRMGLEFPQKYAMNVNETATNVARLTSKIFEPWAS